MKRTHPKFGSVLVNELKKSNFLFYIVLRSQLIFRHTKETLNITRACNVNDNISYNAQTDYNHDMITSHRVNDDTVTRYESINAYNKYFFSCNTITKANKNNICDTFGSNKRLQSSLNNKKQQLG